MKKIRKNLIKSKYTSSDIKDIYYGTDPKKSNDFSNPAYRKMIALTVLLWIVWLLYLFILIKTNIIYSYDNLISSNANKFLYEIGDATGINWFQKTIESNANTLAIAITPVLIILTLIGTFWLLLLPTVLIPYKLANIVIKKTEHYFIEKNMLYKAPISYKEYIRFENLYKEAEKVEKYLMSSNIIDIHIEDEDTIHLSIHDQLVSKDLKFYFKGLTNKIFTANYIDFSVIDREWDKTIENHQIRKFHIRKELRKE